MTKMIIFCFLMFSFLVQSAALAQTTYPDPKRQTVFNNLTDKLATLGEDPKDANEILQERRKLRRIVRQSQIDRAKRKATQARIKQEQQIILEKINAPSQ